MRKLTPEEQKRRKEYGTLVEYLSSGDNGRDKPLSHKDLAGMVGVNRECISKRIHGHQVVTKEALMALRYIKATPEFLPGANDVPPPAVPKLPVVNLDDDEDLLLLAGL
jgi:hypothetical protein